MKTPSFQQNINGEIQNERTIKRIWHHKNFGFISIEDQENDIFFHRSGVEGSFDDLKIGDEVEFETEDTEKGN